MSKGDQCMSIRVAVADDEALVASSLSTLLSLEPDIEVVATCNSGEELMAWVAAHPVDVCVVDLQMGGISGVDVAARLREAAPAIGVLIVTSHAQPKGLKEALLAGATGFVPKTATAAEFAAAVRSVNAGKKYVDAELAAAALYAKASPLTEREAELLTLVPEGLSVEEMARRVHLAPGTVRNYLSSAMTKVGAANRIEGYRKAAEAGWL